MFRAVRENPGDLVPARFRVSQVPSLFSNLPRKNTSFSIANRDRVIYLCFSLVITSF